MKRNSYLYITAMAAAIMGCMAAGCQKGLQDEYGLTDGYGTEENGGSRTQLVEKNLTDVQAESLSTLFTDEEKQTVERLVIQGELCGADILFIRTELPKLVELDLGNVFLKITGTDSDYYSTNGEGNLYQKLTSSYILPVNMFNNDGGMKKIVLPNTIEEISDHAFSGFTSLEEIGLPSRLIKIGYGAFQSCLALKSINFTPFVKEIAEYAFADSGLESVVIPKHVQYVGEHAFYNNKNLTSVRIENGKCQYGGYVFYGCGNLAELVMDNEMESIPDYMFTRCYKLENVTLPQNLKSIGIWAFSQTGLTRIDIPQGVKNIYYDAFDGCSSLKEVVFASNKFDQLGSDIFRDCTSLETINLPDMEIIPTSFLYGCTSLKNISIPQTVKEIGNYAFCGTGIEEISIGNNVETMGEFSFGSTKLKTITVPENVKEVSYNILNSCYDIESIYWYSDCNIDTYGINPNVFLFMNSKNGCTPGWSQDIKNVVIDGTAEQIICRNDWDQCKFACPQEVQTKYISFTKNFSGWTNIGSNNSWYSICLPFKPTKIVTEDGRTLAPFGSSLETEDTKPFWLRTVTEEGFVDATDIEPYKPYIICMPYNTNDYLPEYNINGDVTFIGENITLQATPETLEPAAGPGYKFYPAMDYITGSENIYSLTTWGNSSFSNNNEVRPFEAYIVMDNQSGGETENVDVTRVAKAASRTAAVYEKRKGVPHISDIK